MQMLRILVLMTISTAVAPAIADDNEYTLVIENHRFAPQELHVPSATKVRLIIRNKDATPEEFESYELNREKIVRGNATISVYIGPLEPGRYPFFGEFHMDTAQGVIVAD